jgi:hypothetical protein
MKINACALSRLSSEAVPDPADSIVVSFVNQHIINSFNQSRMQTSERGNEGLWSMMTGQASKLARAGGHR